MKIKMLVTEPYNCGIGIYGQREIKGLRDFFRVPVKEVYIKPNRLNPFYYIKKLKECAFGSNIVHIQFDYPFFGTIHGLFPGIYIPLFYPLLYLIQRYKSRTGSNIITSMHEIVDLKDCKVKPYYWLLNQIVARCSAVVIVFTREAKECLLRQRIAEEKIKQMSLGILCEPVFYQKEDAKARLGFDPSDNIATILGFVHENKGHDLLVEAFKEVKGKLLIAGDTRLEEDKPYLEQLKSRVTELGMEDKVVFLGYVSNEELPIVLSAADVMVLPYRRIRQSAVLNWSFAYHLPTITSGLPYFIELKEKYGCVYIMGDSLSEDINGLLGDKQLQQELRNRVEEYAKENSYRDTIFNIYMTYLEMVEAEHPDEMYKDKYQKERVNFLLKNTSTNGRTLEVGCATGYVLNKVCQNSGIGIDTRKDRLLLAKRKYPHLDFIVAPGDRLPFKANSFDTVLLAEVLEHVDYAMAKEMVREAKRVGGRILFTVPNASGKWGPLADHKWLPSRELVLSLAQGISIKVENKDFIYGVIEDEINAC